MERRQALIPRELLLDRELKPTAKLLWMVTQLHSPCTTAALARLTGLSEPTIAHSRTDLSGRGWSDRATDQAGIPLPSDLLADRRVGVQAKLLYGALQLTPEFRNPSGRFTYAKLRALTGISLPTIRMATAPLVDTGWLRVSQANQLSPIEFVLRNPIEDQISGELELLKLRVDEAEFKGEALMREYLSLLIDSEEFEDNAFPGFLRNPSTDEPLQFDRYYHCGVAFEYNGPQHYRTTSRYPKEKKVKAQRTRDLIKAGICLEKGIQLIVIHPGDHTLRTMTEKIGVRLPRRDLRGKGPLISYLEKAGQEVLRTARKYGWTR